MKKSKGLMSPGSYRWNLALPGRHKVAKAPIRIEQRRSRALHGDPRTQTSVTETGQVYSKVNESMNNQLQNQKARGQ